MTKANVWFTKQRTPKNEGFLCRLENTNTAKDRLGGAKVGRSQEMAKFRKMWGKRGRKTTKGGQIYKRVESGEVWLRGRSCFNQNSQAPAGAAMCPSNGLPPRAEG